MTVIDTTDGVLLMGGGWAFVNLLRKLCYTIVVTHDSQDFIVVRGVFLRRVYPPRAGFYPTDAVVHHGPEAAPIPSAN